MGIYPGRCNPFRVVDPNPIRTQGSAGAQPWAKRLNPFGIRLAAIPRIPNSKRRPRKMSKLQARRFGAEFRRRGLKSRKGRLNGTRSNRDLIKALEIRILSAV